MEEQIGSTSRSANEFVEEITHLLNTSDARKRAVLHNALNHFLAFVKETNPTNAEWPKIAEYLTEIMVDPRVRKESHYGIRNP